ncbi:UNVERIFIED_CONTAM: hypothetical protein RMT77_013046 [Armadillidium vulgare]
MAAANADPLSEILIYTTCFYKKHEGLPIECQVEEISVNAHWTFVLLSGSVTMYVDAYNKDGKLDTRFFYAEPQDVITKTSFGFVRATADDIIRLVYESSQRGVTYGLSGGKANSQSFVKEILNELGVGSDLKIINDTYLGFWMETARKLSDLVF